MATKTTPTSATPHHTAGGPRAGQPEPRPRDATISAIVLSVAATVWFGWAQEGESLGAALAVGSVAALVVAVVAVVATVRVGGATTMGTSRHARRVYQLTVAAEVLAIFATAALLNAAGAPEYLPAVTLAIVGVHFLPLARVFRLPLLNAAAAVTVLVGLAAVGAGLAGLAAPATVAGGLGGLALLACAVRLLVVVRSSRG